MTAQPLYYPFPVRHVAIRHDIKVAYCDEGSGKETLLFIHGLANYIPVWKHQIKELSRHHRCIALDLPGNGLSSGGNYPYTLFFYAECVKLFADKLGLENIVLAGHSMGGQISVVLGLRYPELINKIILIAPAGIEYFNSLEAAFMQQMLSMGDFIYSDETHIRNSISESFYHDGEESKHLITDLLQVMKNHPVSQWRNMAKASISGMLNEQIQPFLPELKQPVLLIFGDKDRMIPNRLIHIGETIQQVLKKGEALIPDCTSLLVKNAGHFVQIEKRREVNNAITDFLAETAVK